MSQTVGLIPANKAGLVRFPSAVITPSTPVSWTHLNIEKVKVRQAIKQDCYYEPQKN